MSEVTIRLATHDDVPAISNVHVAAAHEAYRPFLPQHRLVSYSVTSRPADWHQSITQQNSLYVAIQDAHIVGFTHVEKFRGYPPGMKGEISALYVMPTHHRRGIGRALFAAGKGWLAVQHLIPVGLWALSQTPAQQFYKAMGGIVSMERIDMLSDLSFTELLFMFT